MEVAFERSSCSTGVLRSFFREAIVFAERSISCALLSKYLKSVFSSVPEGLRVVKLLNSKFLKFRVKKRLLDLEFSVTLRVCLRMKKMKRGKIERRRTDLNGRPTGNCTWNLFFQTDTVLSWFAHQ